MKLTMEQVEAKLAHVWGQEVFVVPYRICGNRYAYVATDHGDHWLPLKTSWVGRRQVFAPEDGYWPQRETLSWGEAVFAASQLAMIHFTDQRNRAALKRLPRAQVIAEARNWTKLGDEIDTWLVPSLNRPGVVYQVNGHCTCPDYQHNGVPGGWCKHRLARALAKRAEELLEEENGAGGGESTPAPVSDPGGPDGTDSTTDPAPGQAQRIDLIVAYQADEAKTLPRINGNGRLVRFLTDGQEAAAPTKALPDLYRWLQDHGYAPDGFQWLGWEHGLRQRRQSYTLEAAH